MGILEEILQKQNQIIDILKQHTGSVVGTSDPDALLGREKICETLNIHHNQFKNIVPELSAFGLTKIDNRWKIRRRDLFFYVESKVKS